MKYQTRDQSYRFRSLACIVLLGQFLLPVLSVKVLGDTSVETSILKAEAQINQADYKGAVDALSNIGQLESRTNEMRRLWTLSITHMRANKPRAALPYLERLVSFAPENPTYRLELATALERTSQNDRARYHYDLSRGADLPPDMAQKVTNRIDRIDRAKNWEGSFEIAVTPESNAARRTQAETIFIGNLPFRLNPDFRAKPAQGLKLGFGLTAIPKLSTDFRARIGLSTEARLYEGSTPDDIQTITELGLMHLGDKNSRIGAGLLFGRRWIDGSEYSSSRGGYLHWARSLGPESRTGISFTLLRDWTDYNSSGLRDATRTVASSKITHLVTPQLQLRLGVQVEKTESVLASETGEGFALNIGGVYAFQGGLILDLDLSTGQLERDAADVLFAIRRQDDRLGAKLKLTHRNWTLHGFAPVIELAIEEQDSTNKIYSYNNTRAALGFTRRF